MIGPSHDPVPRHHLRAVSDRQPARQRRRMGIVYQAHDPRLDRSVAIKLLPPDLTRDDTAKQRFLQEAKAASASTTPTSVKKTNPQTTISCGQGPSILWPGVAPHPIFVIRGERSSCVSARSTRSTRPTTASCIWSWPTTRGRRSRSGSPVGRSNSTTPSTLPARLGRDYSRGPQGGHRASGHQARQLAGHRNEGTASLEIGLKL